MQAQSILKAQYIVISDLPDQVVMTGEHNFPLLCSCVALLVSLVEALKFKQT